MALFKYAAGKHNVFSVNGNLFQQCSIPPTNEALTSGYDVITLATPGRKWYICGVGKHCESGGMKLFINVFVVGDNYGWTLNFDYQAWATGKEFVVPSRKHNVFRINGTQFQQCALPAANEALTSGYDVITLATPGRKWYMCGVGKHCEMGLKLFINHHLPRSNISSFISAKVFTVGDEKGWTLNFDYEAWAKGKEFVVGDQLESMELSFNNAAFLAPTNEALTSGYDVITLATPGRKWYICGVFVVGDNYGWTLNFDYQAWATGKEFIVGDKLVFRYPTGKHNVFRVNGTQFQQCAIPAANEALTSGYDVITLATPGRKWYMCGVVFRYPTGKHNVFRVNGTQFQQCAIPAANEALTSGYDVITLATPARKEMVSIVRWD
ncbi:Cupredoxin [Artemisia annua]|uniref:Cupredoxin n=1 Tax=Artemisia annua TaxID=35608 RepID=A0A2U1NNE8_ARTAN|nr:Cupredoxin [Artemisia annua]